MLDLSVPCGVTINPHIEGWIGEPARRTLGSHQRAIGTFVQRVGADDSVLVEFPDISRLRDGLHISVWLRHGWLWLGGVAHCSDHRIHFWNFKSGDRYVEICGLEFDQVLKLDRPYLRIPTRIFGQLVIGKNVGSDLILTQTFKPNGWDSLHSQKLGRFGTTMSCDDAVVAVFKDWIGKAECNDAIRDLSDLMFGMRSCIGSIGFQRTRQASPLQR